MRSGILSILFVLLAVVQVIAQGAKQSKKLPMPKELVLAIADNGAGRRIEAIEPVAAYLSKEIGVPVRAEVAANSLDLIQKIKEGSVDIAYINGFGYVLGVADSVPLQPLVSPGNADGSLNTYNSCIISGPTSGVKSISDLISTPHHFSFLFVNPTSTSGHLIPRLYLSRMGLKQIETDFKSIDFADNHYKTIERVLSGEFNAGAAAYNIIESMIARGELKREDINILWVSEGITQEPVVIHKQMDQRMQKKITQAMLKLHTKNPELWKHIQQNFSAKDASQYVPAKDENYNSIRNVSGKIEDLVFILNYYMN